MKTTKSKKENELIKLYQQSKLTWGDYTKKYSLYKNKTGYHKIKKFNKKKFKILEALLKNTDKEYKIAISAERKFLNAIKKNLYKSYVQYLKEK